MSVLQHLEAHDFRNLLDVRVDFSSRFNIFYGDNGSGKTSLLEVIYYLGLARSFRTHLPNRLINHHADYFTLFGQVVHHQAVIAIGIQRQRDSASQIHIAGKPVSSTVELAQLLPLQLLDANAHELLTAEAKTRRQFLDWGVFHVEPTFWPCWQRVERILKQRNAALKLSAGKNQIQAWDDEFIHASYALHQLRTHYLQDFIPEFTCLLDKLLPDYEVSVHYQAGWPMQEELGVVLQRSLEHDYRLGYTRFGAHRADLQLRLDEIPAKDVLSQGQQKLVAYALRLAQGALLQRRAKHCVYLIDDLPSELDAHKRHAILTLLTSFQAQLFLTGIAPQGFADLFAAREASWFHVEQGRVQATALEEALKSV